MGVWARAFAADRRGPDAAERAMACNRRRRSDSSPRTSLRRCLRASRRAMAVIQISQTGRPTMSVVSLRIGHVALVLGACAPIAEPVTSTTIDELAGGIEGANCAEVNPEMEGPDGMYDVNSMVRYHHLSEAAYRVPSDQGDVMQVVLPPGFEDLDPAFAIWAKKDAQNF